jgi:hypothetical protein
MNKDKTIKERLKMAGYDVVRVEIDGRFRGIKIVKNGITAHKTPLASVDLAIEICEKEGV